MNSVDRTLEEILGTDLPETDVRNSKFTAKVIKKLSESTVEVTDGDKSAKIDFEATANKRYYKNLEEGCTYTFFKLDKLNMDSLKFTPSSHCKKEQAPSYLKLELKDLVGKAAKEVITGQLLVKVWSIGEVINTNTGKKFRKITLGDSKYTVDLTLWNEKVSLADTLELNCVYSLSNFTLDAYPAKSATEPLNLMHRDRPPFTVMQKVLDKDIPANLKNIQSDIKAIVATGVLDDFENVYSYKSCPGNPGSKRGKKVSEGQSFCAKPNCRRKVEQEALVDSYLTSVVVFGNDNEIYSVRAFNKTLEHLEQGEGDPKTKLSHLIGKTVTIKAKKDANPSSESEPMMESITVVE